MLAWEDDVIRLQARLAGAIVSMLAVTAKALYVQLNKQNGMEEGPNQRRDSRCPQNVFNSHWCSALGAVDQSLVGLIGSRPIYIQKPYH